MEAFVKPDTSIPNLTLVRRVLFLPIKVMTFVCKGVTVHGPGGKVRGVGSQKRVIFQPQVMRPLHLTAELRRRLCLFWKSCLLTKQDGVGDCAASKSRCDRLATPTPVSTDLRQAIANSHRKVLPWVLALNSVHSGSGQSMQRTLKEPPKTMSFLPMGRTSPQQRGSGGIQHWAWKSQAVWTWGWSGRWARTKRH